MKIRLAIAAAASLALSACGGGDKPAPAASESSATAAPSAAASASPSAAAAAPAKGDKPSKEFIVGKWGDNGDCALAIDFKADGTSDGPFGNWAYADGVISFPETPEAKITVTVVDDKTMDSVNAQGGKHQMTRCP